MERLRSFSVLVILFGATVAESSLELVLVTFASPGTDEYSRLERNAEFFNVTLVSAETGDSCSDSKPESSLGIMTKFRFSEGSSTDLWKKENLVLILVDNSDILVASATTILDAFVKMNAKVIFSSERNLFCNESNENCNISCSGRMIGYKEEFFTVIKYHLYFRARDQKVCLKGVYNNAIIKKRLKSAVDNTNAIFHNVNNESEKIELQVLRNMTVIKNLQHNTFPAVLHGDGTSQLRLNYLSNYVPDGWHPRKACKHCPHDVASYQDDNETTMPHTVVAIFLLPGSPFLKEFFSRVANLSYPKSRITLFIHSSTVEHERESARFLIRYRKMYKSVQSVSFPGQEPDDFARKSAIDFCLQQGCEFFFSIDSSVQITNSMTLRYLIRKNRRIIAPLVKRHRKLWSNFWGSISENGFYSRSDDYLAIIGNEKIGVWNVPFVNSIYLVKRNALKELTASVPNPYVHGDLPTDMAFCRHIRENRIFMFVTNEENFGRLLDIDETQNRELKVHPDLWEIKRNEADWLEKYVHPDFWNTFDLETELDAVCPDVFQFPFMTESFADEIVDTVEAANLWSDGSIFDERLDSGYQGAPAIDVRSHQIGFHAEWIYFLRNHVSPLVTRIFHGYATSCNSAKMFITRYRADEIAEVLPHHDESIVTINTALNTRKVDFEGGGCHFVQHNCSALDLPKGWAIMHPGKLTHYHQGLPTTKGVRYIMVTFIDPV